MVGIAQPQKNSRIIGFELMDETGIAMNKKKKDGTEVSCVKNSW